MYRYTVTKFTNTGVEQGTEQTGSSALLVLGDRMAGTLAVEVIFVASLAEGEMSRVQLQLKYADAPEWADGDVTKMFTDVSEPFTWSVPMQDRTKKSYTYRVIWFRENGDRVTLGPLETDSEMLVLDPKNPEVAS